MENSISPLTRTFPSKLLLFGEYTVLNGSQALAIPLPKWNGQWIQKENQPDDPIPPFYHWLLRNNKINDSVWKRLQSDWDQGWRYESDIPIGFGVGSSGALVASFYDRYIRELQSPLAAADMMAEMESFFHGTSSGLDPLVSLSQQAVLKDDRGQFHLANAMDWPEGWHIYLYNSGQSRETSGLVQLFKDHLTHNSFRQKVERDLTPIVDHAIHFFMQESDRMLEECISVISLFQREYLIDLIPSPVQQVWDDLMRHAGVYVKLCGAGGGGFYLVISTQGPISTDHPLISLQAATIPVGDE
jgi:mevalonate kinase